MLSLKALSKHLWDLPRLPLRDGLTATSRASYAGCHEAYEGSGPGDAIWPVGDPLKGGRFFSACTSVITYVLWPAISC